MNKGKVMLIAWVWCLALLCGYMGFCHAAEPTHSMEALVTTALSSTLRSEASGQTSVGLNGSPESVELQHERPCDHAEEPGKVTNDVGLNTLDAGGNKGVKTMGELFPPGVRQRQPSCRLALPEAERLWRQDAAVFIDIRTPVEFRTFRIRHSLNIAPQMIKRKPFLKDRHIVLVDIGYAYRQLDALCENLHQAGFARVSVLDGGLNAWRQQVGALDGDALAQRSLNQVSPAAFFRERAYAHWAELDVSVWTARQAHTPSSHKTKIDEDRWVQLRNFLVTQRQKFPPAASYVLIVSETGKGYEAIDKAVQDLSWTNVFYLKDGRQGYKTFLKKQQAMWSRVPGKHGAVTPCGGKT